MDKMRPSIKRNKFIALICLVFGHRYKISRPITKHINEYQCVVCKKQVTTETDGSLTELCSKRKDINSILREIYMKRSRKSPKKPATLKVA